MQDLVPGDASAKMLSKHWEAESRHTYTNSSPSGESQTVLEMDR